MKEQSRINEQDSWKRFFTSGKVEDYLSYVSDARSEDVLVSKKADWAGDSPHAGVYRSNGNYIETDTYR